jgi:hypothetical protein
VTTVPVEEPLVFVVPTTVRELLAAAGDDPVELHVDLWDNVRSSGGVPDETGRVILATGETTAPNLPGRGSRTTYRFSCHASAPGRTRFGTLCADGRWIADFYGDGSSPVEPGDVVNVKLTVIW